MSLPTRQQTTLDDPAHGQLDDPAHGQLLSCATDIYKILQISVRLNQQLLHCFSCSKSARKNFNNASSVLFISISLSEAPVA